MNRLGRDTRKLVAASLTIVALAAAALLAGRGFGTPKIQTPEARIDRLFETAAAGDVEGYLECFSGALRERLENERRERGDQAFQQYLRSTIEGVVGRAIRQDLTKQLADGRIRLVVERVYEGRPWERQAYRLEPVDGTWRVYHIEPAELFEPPVPYGTPAFPDAAPPGESGGAHQRQAAEQAD